MTERTDSNKFIEKSNYREKWGKRAGIVGFVSNLFLFVSKLTVGILFNSIAITADAINNLSDTATSLITIFGFKLSAKPADEEHPYGHARMEYISGFMVSLIIVFLGLQLLKSSIEKIISPDITEFSYISVIILILSILAKGGQWFFYRRIAKKIRSGALAAASQDSRNDIFATLAILISIIFYYFTKIDLDGYMGAAVALVILIFGIKLVIDTINPLLGTAPTRAFVETIYKKILSYDGIIGLHDLTVHNYGYKQSFASVHCEVPADQDIIRSHDIIDNIERDFLNDMNVKLVIHLDPVVVNDERTNKAKEAIAASVYEFSPQISIHDFRAVWGITHSKFIFDVVLPFDFKYCDDEVIEIISKKVTLVNPEYSAVITVDHDYVPKI
jgi:cation diffusion facilitator family transporter